MTSSIINFRPVGPEFFGEAGVRWYRSSALSGLDRGEARHLHEDLGIRTYIDLRSEDEIARTGPPHALMHAGIRWVCSPVCDYPDHAISAKEPTIDDYVTYYTTMVEAARPGFAAAVLAVDTCGHAPLVFGCHAGKDRTGILAALLMDREHAPVELIAIDYARSGPLLASAIDQFREKWERRGMTRESYARRMHTPAEVMIRFLDAMHHRYGGLSRYVLGM
jgi:protein-tyrosine phosphatase